MDEQRSYFTPGQLARRWHRFGYDVSTVRRWCASGKLKARRTPGGHYRALRPDVEAFERERGIAAS